MLPILTICKDFLLLSGDDATACDFILKGGHGVISVTANVAPKLMHELCVAAIAGNARRAMEIQRQLMPVHKHLFVEANPIPLKWAMARLGLKAVFLRPVLRALMALINGDHARFTSGHQNFRLAGAPG